MNHKLFLLLLVALLLSACGSSPVAPLNDTESPFVFEPGTYSIQTNAVCDTTNTTVPVTVHMNAQLQDADGNPLVKFLLDFGFKTNFNRDDYFDVALRPDNGGLRGDIIGRTYDRGDIIVTSPEPGVLSAKIMVDPTVYNVCWDMGAMVARGLTVESTLRKLARGEAHPTQAPQ